MFFLFIFAYIIEILVDFYILIHPCMSHVCDDHFDEILDYVNNYFTEYFFIHAHKGNSSVIPSFFCLSMLGLSYQGNIVIRETIPHKMI